MKPFLLALLSRGLILVLMVGSSRLFTDLDSSKRLQLQPCENKEFVESASTTSNGFVLQTATDMSVWDAVHFGRIAQCGYETDMLRAFFPLLPWIMKVTASWSGASCQEPTNFLIC